MNDVLKEIVISEEFDAEPEALVQIARQSTGALRDAIALLDQLSSTGEKITLAFTQSVLGTATNQLVVELLDLAINNQSSNGIKTIYQALNSGSDPRQFARQIVEYLRTMLLFKHKSSSITEITEDMLEGIKKQSEHFSSSTLRLAINAFNKAASDDELAGSQIFPLTGFLRNIGDFAEWRKRNKQTCRIWE